MPVIYAERLHRGVFEQASGGTLFLDEVTEMPIELQVKLLRVLETGTVMRVGGEKAIAVDVRVIAATNRVPEQAVQEGKLREDLWYRLNVFPIALPPLRERPGDIELLARHFLDELNAGQGTKKRWTAEAVAALERFDWPGNVRELKNRVHRAFILAEEDVGPECLPGHPTQPHAAPGAAISTSSENGGVLQVRVGSSVEKVEQQLIMATLDACGGNKQQAAAVLGVSLKTLYNRLAAYRVASSAS